MRRRDSERDRLDRIESKIAPVIGGTIAGLGLSVDKAGTPMDYAVGGLLLIPLAMLFMAFRTFTYMDTPSLDELVRTYERWPLTYIRSVVLGTAEAVAKNGPVIDKKARDLNRTMAVLFVAVIMIIAYRTYEASRGRDVSSHRPCAAWDPVLPPLAALTPAARSSRARASLAT